MSQKLSKTYRETGEEFIKGLEAEAMFKEGSAPPAEQFKFGVVGFAKYLDSFPTLSDQLELIALKRTSELDREFMQMLIDALGKEKATELAREFTGRHKHTKKNDEAGNAPDVPGSQSDGI